MDFSDQNVRQEIRERAEHGDAEANWLIYREFRHFSSSVNDMSGKYAHLMRAVTEGSNDARLELALLLRKGFIEVQDGKFRLVDQQPTQQALDLARNLLMQATVTGDERASRTLQNLPENAWNAATAERSSFGVSIDHRSELEAPSTLTPGELKASRTLTRAVFILVGIYLLWRAYALVSNMCAVQHC